MINKKDLRKIKMLQIRSRFKELKNVISNLEESNHKLKKTNQLKDEFVSLATHQLRGPLGAIKGYISLILEGDYGEVPKGLTEPLNIIFKSTDSLSKTVNDFLDVSRIEQEQMRYYLKSFNLADLVNEVLKEMKNDIKSKGLELRLDIMAGPFLVHCDKAKLKQVLINLIDNSSKYTETGWIEIGLKKHNQDQVLFSIKDSGVGIKAETMPKLFQKFSRCVDAHEANILGTGLGLYVAKKMVEANSGHIWAESAGEGKGTQFYVTLPLIK